MRYDAVWLIPTLFHFILDNAICMLYINGVQRRTLKMDNKTIDELKENCEAGSLYSFIASNYWELSVYELRDILEETIEVATKDMTDEERADFTRKVRQSLEDNTHVLEAE